ncbi:arylsulfatase [Ruania alba]|uniref:Arylsulfatase A n=1 Tax=Ruania alba TaxID=648782 RepID=A0A1H5NBK0_9MICO|nr:arylsulfatase [Ruania alba]SEE99012.1 Arylsulfatase A [Ruania alba]
MAERPNVWFVMTDQQRWDSMGYAGNDVIETPNLDQLASEGSWFEHAYSATPSCIPARASLMTGQDPWHTGILGMGEGQGPAQCLENTLPESLARAGYHTQAVGKLHVHPQRDLIGFHHTVLDESGRREHPQVPTDYDRWLHREVPDAGTDSHGIGWNSLHSRAWHLAERQHPTYWTATESIDFLRRRDPSKPFFLMTSFARPHSPYDPPEPLLNQYLDADLPEPWIGDWAARHAVASWAPDAWRGVRSREQVRRTRAGYYGTITHIDQQIGRIRFNLEREGLLDNTIIVFTSDHGDMQGDHHLWRKTYAYEGSAHIPLFVVLPQAIRERYGIEPGTRSEAPVCLQDVMPTILDACGIEIPESVDGRSVLPVLADPDAPWRDAIHGEHSTCYDASQEMQYLTDGRQKYIWFAQDGAERLFDLVADPHEERDLAADPAYAETLEHWRNRLVEIVDARDCGWTENGRMVPRGDGRPLVSPHYAQRLARHGV